MLLLAGLLGWLTKPVVAETNCEGLGGEPLYECQADRLPICRKPCRQQGGYGTIGV